MRAIENWIKNVFGSNYNFYQILIDSPSQLKELTVQFHSSNLRLTPSILNIKKIYKKFSTIKNTPFRALDKNKYSGYNLVEKTGVSVCPYCNRNYVFNISRTNHRTSQIDHFYDKDCYPFLAMSYFNLVPSCPTCNHIKSNKAGNYYNPYISCDSSIELIEFSIKLKGANFLDSTDDLQINLEVDPILEVNIQNLKLREIYNHHKDLAQELIKKKRIYEDSYIDLIFKTYEGSLFKSKDQLTGLILGNFITEEELSKRPFSKFTKDIWNQLTDDPL